MKQIAPLDSDVDMSALMVITNHEYNCYICYIYMFIISVNM